MDAELKQHLENMESRLMAHTSRECGKVETKLLAHTSQECEKIETRLLTHASDMEARLKTHTSQECEKVETRLLTEFFKWGRTSDLRTRQTMENVAVFNERIMALEDRVSSLERSKLPPQADAA